MSALPLLGVNLTDWSRRHGKRLPPYPTAELLALPRVPAAPCLPDDPKEQYSMAVTTWATAVQKLTGMFPSRNPTANTGTLACIGQLAALGIPPAEWVRHRIALFQYLRSENRGPSYPTLAFVYSQKGLSEALEKDLSWLGLLQQPRVFATEESKKAQALWHTVRRLTIHEQPTSNTIAEYERQISKCRRHHAEVEVEYSRRTQAGEYLW